MKIRKIASLIAAFCLACTAMAFNASASVISRDTYSDADFNGTGWYMNVTDVKTSKASWNGTTMTSWCQLARTPAQNYRDYYIETVNTPFRNSAGNLVYARTCTLKLGISAAGININHSTHNMEYACYYNTSGPVSSSKAWLGYVTAEAIYTVATTEYYTIGSW